MTKLLRILLKNQLNLNRQNNAQSLEQWLRKIPDDPGRLLRNKMLFEFKRRGGSNIKNKNFW